jgi:hypothetical protein
MTERQLREIRLDSCYHEATHAVLGYRAGFAIRYVSVETPDRPELRDITMSGITMAPWLAVQVATGLFAAEIAVYRRRGMERPAQAFKAWEQDCRDRELDDDYPDDDVQALNVLQRAFEAGMLPSVEAGYRGALVLAPLDLDHHWLAIVAVAHALEERGYLTGDDCVALITAATI